MRDAGFKRQPQGFRIHIGEHEDFPVACILCHANDEPIAIEVRRKRRSLFQFIHNGLDRGQNAASFAVTQHGQKTHLLGGIVAKDAGKLRGDGFGAGFADTAHGHAQMLRFQHHGTAARAQMAIDRLNNLGGQRLLCLQPLRKDIDEFLQVWKDQRRLSRTGSSRYAPYRKRAPCGARSATKTGYRGRE